MINGSTTNAFANPIRESKKSRKNPPIVRRFIHNFVVLAAFQQSLPTIKVDVSNTIVNETRVIMAYQLEVF